MRFIASELDGLLIAALRGGDETSCWSIAARLSAASMPLLSPLG